MRLHTLLQAMKAEEEEPHPGRRTGQAFPVSPFAPLAYALLLFGATASVFLAGKLQEGALGVFLMCAGTAMIFCPPRVKVEWRLWIAAGALIGCASLALLPAHWLPEPTWRKTMEATPPIVLPGTITAAPALTIFWLTLLALSLLVGLFLLAQPIRTRWMLVFTLAAALAAGVYAAMAIYAKQTGWTYAYSSDASFGFLPNRNHTATFLLVGTLLALGVLGTVLREGGWIAGTLAGGVMAACVAGLAFYSSSRGAILLLLVGVLLWIGGLGRRNRDSRLTISFFAILLASVVMFLIAGGEARDRLFGLLRPTPAPAATAPASTPVHAAEEASQGLSTDFRLKLYRDVLAAIRDFPITGTGLGTFALVFPQYRQASRSEYVALHPDSDWLLFTFETGIPATLCLMVLLALTVSRIGSERDHPSWPLRWGCMVGAAMAALHGAVDVPAHVVPLGWWVLVAAGLALQSARAGADGRSRAQRGLFFVGGVVALAMGGWLARAQWFGGAPSPLLVFNAEQNELFRVIQRDPSRALRLARQMAREHPMEEMTYRILGETVGLFDNTETQMDDAFRAERLMEPVLTDTPFQQGKVWSDADITRTESLWVEALARCVRNYQLAGLSQQGTPTQFFGNLIHLAATKPALQMALWKEVGRGSEYAFAWVENATPPEAREGIARLAADAGFLRGLDTAGQSRFLHDWYRLGNADALATFLDGRKDWQTAAWPVRLHRLADAGHYEQAVREGAEHYGIVLTLPEPGSSGGATPPPADQESSDSVAAFMAYWKAGNVDSARRVLDEAPGDAPAAQLAEIRRLQIALAVHEADWQTAWHRLEQEIALIHPGEAF